MIVETHSGEPFSNQWPVHGSILSSADNEIQRRVGNYLKSRLFLSAATLRIKAANGVVTLQGSVRSFYHKQLCIHCCQRVAGVVQLIDDTHVISVN